jgi:hypothetical protein
MTNTIQNKGLWAKSVEVARENMSACLTYVGIMMVIGFAQDYMSSNSGLAVGQGFAAALLAIPAHLTLLKAGSAAQGLLRTTDNKILWRFFIRTVALGAIALVPALLLMIFMLAMRANPEISVLALLGVFAFLACLVFAKWGTMLPASVLGADTSFAAAAPRGRQSFGCWPFIGDAGGFLPRVCDHDR